MTEVTGNGIVQIAYLHDEHPSHSWHDSMRRTMDYDREHGNRIAAKPLNMRTGSGRLVPNRNFATRLFLDKTPHEWMLFVDTDMGWEDDAVHRLLEAADPTSRPVVGGLCFALMEANYDGMGGHRFTIVPTMYKLGETTAGDPSFCYYGAYAADAVVPVAGTGAAFLLIHRSALEKMRANVGDHWWDQFYDKAGDMVGEDIAFCARLNSIGVVPHVHTGVKTTHHKQIWLSEEDYLAQQATTVAIDPTLQVHVDLQASLASLAANAHVRDDGMLKLQQDLDRYRAIIEATKPEVIVETGTHAGASARWFAKQGMDVITIDVEPRNWEGLFHGTDETGWITFLCSDSADPAVVQRATELVAGRRCMVSLDSDHSAEHVAEEIRLYGPMVSPGCYLVVEDGIFGYAPPQLRAQHGLGGMVGSPLDAIVELLDGKPGWSRDIAIERLSPISHHPAGWWTRHG